MLGLVVGLSLYGNPKVSYQYGFKEYGNSKLKIDGVEQFVGIEYKYGEGKINGGFLQDEVDLKPNPKSSTLEVKKSNLNLRHTIGKNLSLKGSFLVISDNLAPTDGGKIYGIGGTYNLERGFGIALDGYRSSYEPFGVNQYDVAITKGFSLAKGQSKFTLGSKIISIDGEIYNPKDPIPKQYRFTDKEYQTYFVTMSGAYQGFFGGVGAMFGKRIFAVLEDGDRVQHHAMEQDRAYTGSFGKKFKNFDIVAKYSYQNGKELPEKQSNVDTKVTTIAFVYTF